MSDTVVRRPASDLDEFVDRAAVPRGGVELVRWCRRLRGVGPLRWRRVRASASGWCVGVGGCDGPGAVRSRAMRITVVAPSARLAPFVRRFTVIESPAAAARTLLPECGLMLGIRFAGAATAQSGDALPSATLTGLAGTARRVQTSAGGAVFAAFREAGAARFFAPPLHELFGRTIALDALIPRGELERVQDRIAGAPDPRSRVAALDELLRARLSPRDGDPVVEAAVAAIRRDAAVRISALCRALGLSQSALEKRFRTAVGTSPKQLASLIRFRRVIDGRRAGARWSRLAIAAGYFDQAHFNRDFRALVGEAPREYFQRASFCAAPPG